MRYYYTFPLSLQHLPHHPNYLPLSPQIYFSEMEKVHLGGQNFKLFQMEGEDYTTLLQNLQRPINCLTDQDRNIRKGGLTTLSKQLEKASKHNQIKMLTSTNLSKNLLFTLCDPIEANRQGTLNLLEKLLANDLKKDESEPIIHALIQRLNNTPFPQKSEDLREKIIVILKQCLPFKDTLAFHMADLTNALSKCLLDPKAEIKNKTSELINDLSTELRGVIGKYAVALSKSLAENLKNNKYLVRKNTLVTIGRLLITEGAGGNFEHVQTSLKVSLADAKTQVRKAAFDCVAHLLKYMAPKYLKQYEATLVSYLLYGLSDESPQNVSLSIKLLQESGKSIRELQGDELEEEK